MSEEATLKAQAEMGEQARKFLTTPVGKLLIGSADQDLEEAKDKLLELDPYRYTSLVDLQNAIQAIKAEAICALKLKGYIGEAIIVGDQATHTLSSEEID